ncbi:lysosomal/endosomal membrane protein p67 [Angomonas deanei]|uniref:Phospholipase B-like n=1 Tax=Angomonas deanei TaxID=59799 RepID=A0A7G2CQ81_9TRYP|nr:lysosomal/endosomal membrane protein p67 [Angomonas deanei]CAD2221930.1 Phospholipase B, putative [Angomonas deanei]|eukprot:EPY25451.1 lysosomal/endosomal membrane protein p67 [Angomonas deanei]
MSLTKIFVFLTVLLQMHLVMVQGVMFAGNKDSGNHHDSFHSNSKGKGRPPTMVRYVVCYDNTTQQFEIYKNETEAGFPFPSIHNESEDAFLCGNNETGNQTVVSIADVNYSFYVTGWDEVEVTLRSSPLNDGRDDLPPETDLGYYGVGLAEGYATQQQMEMSFYNTWTGENGLGALVQQEGFAEWAEEQVEFLQSIVRDPNSGAYGRQLQRLLSMMAGLVDGYNRRLREELTAGVAVGEERWLNFTTLYWLNAQGEVGDIARVIALSDVSRLAELEAAFPRYLTDLHCSAFIKVVPEVDLFAAHVTWNSYESMMRQYKTYRFEHLEEEEEVRKQVTMSSYPGLVFSLDDWYMTHRQFSIMETTFGLSNNSLFDAVRPRRVPTFLRTQLANLLSSSDPQNWFYWFGLHNSGTYSNQWMVLDMGRLQHVRLPLPSGVFWVGEQLPQMPPDSDESAAGSSNAFNPVSFGMVVEDLTQTLNEQTYWGSYNMPYFEQVYQESGTAAQYAELGELYSYTNTSRARIFRRDQANITSLDGVVRLMRKGDYKRDPFSLIPNCTGAGADGHTCDPASSSFLTIASRGDLNPEGGRERYGPSYARLGHRNHGGTDVKISSWSGMTQHPGDWRAHVVCGPTTAEHTLPTFRWRPGLYDVMPPIWGLPVEYDFPLVQVQTEVRPVERRASHDWRSHRTGIVVIAVCSLWTVVGLCFMVKRIWKSYRVASG